MARQTGRTPEALLGPELPPGLERVWEDFMGLCGRRTLNGMVPSPLTYPDLAAWAQLTGQPMPLEPWRVQMLCRLDDLWLRHVASRSE